MHKALMLRLSVTPLALAASLALGASPAAADVTPDNVAALKVKWDFPAAQVTGTPVLGNGLLYFASWDGFVYAVDPDDGSQTWSYDTGSSVEQGSQSTILVTPGGDVCFGDSLINVTCLDGLTGAVEWGPKSLGTPGVDNIWSGLATANGRLFISVSSILDTPCTKGRLVALDLATGADIWTHQTVPDAVCVADTSISCTTNADCPSAGECRSAVGAGVTATVSFDPTGNFLYMNPVSCFTFPAVGDSGTILKLDAATGAVVWQTRVESNEQFGFCADDTAVDCGVDGDCTTGTCSVPKPLYHDYGFLNGPVPVDVPDGGGTKTLLISASKGGTIYALNEPDGSIEWTNEVMPQPQTPTFAGFGLFNGPIAIENGRGFAALYEFVPARLCDNDTSKGCTSDANCPGGTCLETPEHLMSFDAATGATIWTDEIGTAWAGVSAVNGVVYSGTNGAATLFAYDAEAGTRLAELPLPSATVSRALPSGDDVYVGYGLLSPPGGIRAFTLRCPAEPTAGCLDAAKSSFQIKKKGGGKDQLKWKLSKGSAFDQSALGDPTTNTHATLCVYDGTGGVPARVSTIDVGPGTAWDDKAPKGFNYKDKDGSQGGVQKAQLKTGADGKSKVQVKAKGANLVVPDPVAADKYFNVDTEVTVQLLTGDDVSTCWTSTFTAPTKNDGEQFKAKAP